MQCWQLAAVIHDAFMQHANTRQLLGLAFPAAIWHCLGAGRGRLVAGVTVTLLKLDFDPGGFAANLEDA